MEKSKKLDSCDFARIRELYSSGRNRREIAEMLGLGVRSVERVITAINHMANGDSGFFTGDYQEKYPALCDWAIERLSIEPISREAEPKHCEVPQTVHVHILCLGENELAKAVKELFRDAH